MKKNTMEILKNKIKILEDKRNKLIIKYKNNLIEKSHFEIEILRISRKISDYYEILQDLETIEKVQKY